MKACGGNRGIVPFILNFSSECRWVVKFTFRQLDLGKETPVPIKKELGFSQTPYGL